VHHVRASHFPEHLPSSSCAILARTSKAQKTQNPHRTRIIRGNLTLLGFRNWLTILGVIFTQDAVLPATSFRPANSTVESFRVPASEPIKGRGAASNPTNLFLGTNYEREIDWNSEDDLSPRTQIIKDTTQSIIAYNNSPDVGFDASIN